MATASFRSTTRRSAAGGAAAEDAGSSTRHRRSRSLSRYSGRFPPPAPESSEESFATPRGRFVNKTRGSGFAEISLDDLADEFFGATKGEEEEASRSGRRRVSEMGSRVERETESARRRGRSVSRNGDGNRPVKEDEKGFGRSSGVGKLRRSVSVVRYRGSNLEDDIDKSYDSRNQIKLRNFTNGTLEQLSSNKQMIRHPALRRSMSQKDLSQSHDNLSSHSSSLTDDEARDFRYSISGTEKTIWALEKREHPIGHGEGTGLYEAMCKEVKHAVEEIRTELEKVMIKKEPVAIANGDDYQPKSSNVINVISEIRRNYTSKLEQSEKRKQDLLAELAAEEQREQELTKIVRELLPARKQIAAPERPSWPKKRINDRRRMSECLMEDAEKYFEDFLSNVEDTDISSFDGERSDTSSTIGGLTKLRESANTPDMHLILANAAYLPPETDGVILPWLQWETSNDASPSPCKSKAGMLETQGTAGQETSPAYDSSIRLPSSLGSWSPEGNDSSSAVSRGVIGSKFGELGSRLISSSSSFSTRGGLKGSSFDMEEYLQLQNSEELLFERLRQRQRIDSGSMILCGRTLL